MLTNNKFLGILRNKIDFTKARHNAISINLANVDTPKARTRDVLPFADFIRRNNTEIVATDPMHLTPVNKARLNKIFYPIEETEEKLNGNNISLDNEVMKMNDNNVEHNKAVTVYKNFLNLIRIATGVKL